jgi:hypothetical protein
MGLKRSLGVVLVVTGVASVAAFAQIAKPPVAALAQARVAQDYAQQQAPRVIDFAKEEAISTQFVSAPAVGSTSGGTSADNTNWLKVEFHFSVNPPDGQKYPWVDSADFKVWIEGRDLYSSKAPAGSTEGVAVALVGSVTYVNLESARDAYGVFYVHPSALARYSGGGSTEDFDRKFDIRITASVGGKVVDQYDKKNDYSDWTSKVVAVDHMVFRQDQSPFLMADTTRYPMSKLQDSGGSQ